MNTIELRGGPLDGRTVPVEDRQVVVSIVARHRQRVDHFYGSDGRYLGQATLPRSNVWRRLCSWWGAQ